MKVVLYSDIRGSDLYLPLNLLALASVLERDGHDVRVLDGQVMPVDALGTVHAAAKNADLVLLSSYTGPSIRASAELSRLLRAEPGSRPMVGWGGYHASLAGRQLLREGLADFIVQGPGEPALAKLGSLMRMRPTGDAVPGASYLDRDGSLITFAPVAVDMNALPEINYRHVDVKSYFTSDRKIVQYVSSYGCPYACGFCAEPAHSRRHWRSKSPRRVVSDIQKLWRSYAPERISFVDPNFSSSPARVIEICDLLRSSETVPFNCNMRARDVNRIAASTPLRKLREAGLRRVFIGVESGSDRQLELMNKSSTSAEHVTAVTALDDAGIEVQVSFMHDLPRETDEESELTIACAQALLHLRTPGSSQSHHFFMPYPGTAMGAPVDSLEAIPTDDWTTSSTFAGSQVWSGNQSRRARVAEALRCMSELEPSVISPRDVDRLYVESTPRKNLPESMHLQLASRPNDGSMRPHVRPWTGPVATGVNSATARRTRPELRGGEL